MTSLPFCPHDFWPLHANTKLMHKRARHIKGVAWQCRCGELADTETAMQSESTAARWGGPTKEVPS